MEVGILGATGMVGQHFIKFLQRHPGFQLTWLGASDRSAGKKYREAANWQLDGAMPASVADLTVEECRPGNAPKLLFSAMDASVATEIEQAFAQGRAHRGVEFAQSSHGAAMCRCWCRRSMPDHLQLLPGQQQQRGWNGQIVTNPNCSTIVLTMALAPLRQFGITR